MARRVFGLACAILALAMVSGCGGESNPIPVSKTSGKLVWQGKSVAGLLMVFHPTNPDAPRLPVQPTGIVNADGTFTVTCYDTSDGLPPGEYIVSIREAPRADDAPKPTMPPAKYLDKATSPFRGKVEKKPLNELEPFEITK